MGLWDKLTKNKIKNTGANLFGRLTDSGEAPVIESVQLDDKGNIDSAKALEIELNSKPLTLAEKLTGRRQEADIQKINPETGKGELVTVVNNRPGLFDDISAGYRENRSTPIAQGNFLQNTTPDGRNKGFGYRLGEAAGSAARMLNNPFGRGLAVAGLVGLTGGNALEALTYGATTGMNNQANVMQDKLYRQALIDNYGYTPEQLNQITGYIGKDTYKNLADTHYRNQLNSYRNRNLDQTSYVKMVKELDTLHKTGQISDDAYLATLRDLNAQYEGANTYDIASVGASNDTRKTNSQISLDNARTENLKNPKPRVNISYRHGKTDINYNHQNSANMPETFGEDNGKPIGTSNTSGKVKMLYQGKLYNVDANRVQEYINAGGEVVK